ncbi:unnamed protein product [Orchesella dallaii]|uniref:Galactosylgalactosylxylosylprotein 3-beta-glucuronosyltransferase n=1 Tax=Orchesella dallaii TaxID=48710 RepID=A0ABP1R374_9HEXA
MINPASWELFILLVLLCGIFLVVFRKTFKLHFLRRLHLQRNEKKFVAACAGMYVAILCRFWFHHGDHTLTRPWHILSNGSLIDDKSYNSQLLDSTKKPVIFITTTSYSTIQPALLTRLAQALYPVRDMVQWIVVSLPLETGLESEQIVDDETGDTFANKVQNNKEFVRVHLENLDKLLGRFGVPYVILRSRPLVKSKWGGFIWPRKGYRDVNAYQTGLLWVIKNLPKGIILLGDEDFSYHSGLFKELVVKLQQTQIAACWPVGFGQNNAAMTIPLTSKVYKTSEDVRLVGYDDGRIIWTGGIKLEIGAFAVDLEYLRNKVPYTEYWKLTYSQIYSNDDFGIPVGDIQVLGKQGTEIYVWRTKTIGVKWPQYLPGNQSLTWETNLRTLLKTVFGPRFYMLNDNISSATASLMS